MRFRRAGVPLYFLSLGLGVLIKFYMSPVAAILSFSVILAFMGVWWKYHSGQMTYLTHSKALPESHVQAYESWVLSFGLAVASLKTAGTGFKIARTHAHRHSHA